MENNNNNKLENYNNKLKNNSIILRQLVRRRAVRQSENSVNLFRGFNIIDPKQS